MNRLRRLLEVARSDRTFSLQGALWVGRCLICNGPIAFDASNGEGATLEHIRARGRGGDDSLKNLGIVHARCNSEKGVRWDPRRRRSSEEYEGLVKRLAQRRRERFVAEENENPPGSR